MAGPDDQFPPEHWGFDVVDDNGFRSLDSIHGDLNDPAFLEQHFGPPEFDIVPEAPVPFGLQPALPGQEPPAVTPPATEPAMPPEFDVTDAAPQAAPAGPEAEPPPAPEPAYGPLPASQTPPDVKSSPWSRITREDLANVPQEVQAQLVATGQIPAEWTDPVTQEVAKNLGLGPAELAGQGVRREENRKQYWADQLESLNKQDQVERNQIESDDKARWLDSEAELAELRKEEQLNGEEKVDRDHWWETRSTGEKIAAILGAALGGLLVPYGVKNSALDMIMRAVDQDLDAQKSTLLNKSYSLQRKKGLLAMRMEKYKDEYTARTAARISSLAAAKEALAVEVQKFDPNGTTAQKITETILATQQQQAAMLREWTLKREEQLLKFRKQDEEERHNRRAEQAADRQATASLIGASAAKQNANTNQYDTFSKSAINLVKLPGEIEEASARVQKLRAEGKATVGSLEIGHPVTGNTIGRFRPGYSSEAVGKMRAKLSSNRVAYDALQIYANKVEQLGRTVNWEWDRLKNDERKQVEVWGDDLRSVVRRERTGAVANEKEMEELLGLIPKPSEFAQNYNPAPLVRQFAENRALEVEREMVGASDTPDSVRQYYREMRDAAAAVVPTERPVDETLKQAQTGPGNLLDRVVHPDLYSINKAGQRDAIRVLLEEAERGDAQRAEDLKTLRTDGYGALIDDVQRNRKEADRYYEAEDKLLGRRK